MKIPRRLLLFSGSTPLENISPKRWKTVPSFEICLVFFLFLILNELLIGIPCCFWEEAQNSSGYSWLCVQEECPHWSLVGVMCGSRVLNQDCCWWYMQEVNSCTSLKVCIMPKCDGEMSRFLCVHLVQFPLLYTINNKHAEVKAARRPVFQSSPFAFPLCPMDVLGNFDVLARFNLPAYLWKDYLATIPH